MEIKDVWCQYIMSVLLSTGTDLFITCLVVYINPWNIILTQQKLTNILLKKSIIMKLFYYSDCDM